MVLTDVPYANTSAAPCITVAVVYRMAIAASASRALASSIVLRVAPCAIHHFHVLTYLAADDVAEHSL